MSELNAQIAMMQDAVALATKAHCGQIRKGTPPIPYVTHCLEVAKRVSRYTDDVEIISAAFLHDVLEDTTLTARTLLRDFSAPVLQYVLECSRDAGAVSRPEKYKFMESFRTKSEGSVLIKIADRLCNCRDYLNTAGNGDNKHDLYYAEYALQAHPLLERVEHSGMMGNNGRMFTRDILELYSMIEELPEVSNYGYPDGALRGVTYLTSKGYIN
jgi:(p)ppGpp synthase/HD superfamily hydrolase